jgi:AcrR family transcriptional regulator
MSKHRPSKLIWLRPEPGERKTRLSRAGIAAAAIAIADAEGFEAVSMRRLAAKLDAGAMSLYHYLRTKDDLVALMDDALLGEILVPEKKLPKSWRAALLAIARRTRDVFARHPWALLSMRGAPPGPNAMLHFEQSLAALADSPFGLEQRLELLKMVDDFVFGHALRAAEVQATDRSTIRNAEELGRRMLATGRYPHTASLAKLGHFHDEARQLAWLTGDEGRFDRALASLLDGAVRQLRQRRRSSARRRTSGT